jgi:hypothetical protein
MLDDYPILISRFFQYFGETILCDHLTFSSQMSKKVLDSYLILFSDCFPILLLLFLSFKEIISSSCPILFSHKKTIEHWVAAQCYFQFYFHFIFSIFHWNNIEQPPNIIFWVFFFWRGFFLLLFIQYYGEILSVNFLILFTHKKNIEDQVAIQCSFQKNNGTLWEKYSTQYIQTKKVMKWIFNIFNILMEVLPKQDIIILK